jgi:hypothetical protein
MFHVKQKSRLKGRLPIYLVERLFAVPQEGDQKAQECWELDEREGQQKRNEDSVFAAWVTSDTFQSGTGSFTLATSCTDRGETHSQRGTNSNQTCARRSGGSSSLTTFSKRGTTHQQRTSYGQQLRNFHNSPQKFEKIN